MGYFEHLPVHLSPPLQARKRFTIPSFLARRTTPSTSSSEPPLPPAPPASGSPGKTEGETPRRSLKERLLSSYAGQLSCVSLAARLDCHLFIIHRNRIQPLLVIVSNPCHFRMSRLFYMVHYSIHCSSRLPTRQVDASSAPATTRQRLTTGTSTAQAVSAASAAALHSSPKGHDVYIAHRINSYMLQTLIGAFTCRERYHNPH